MEKYYTVEEVAEILNIKCVTVRKHAQQGKIRAKKLTNGTKKWLIAESEIKRLLGEK